MRPPQPITVFIPVTLPDKNLEPETDKDFSQGAEVVTKRLVDVTFEAESVKKFQ